MGGGAGGEGGAPASKIDILTLNMESAETAQMLCEAIALDAISATASGTIEMTAMQLFAIVTQVYTLISADFLYVGEIEALMIQIQSAKLTVALTEAEISQVSVIVSQFAILIVDIQSTIAVVGSTLSDEAKVEVMGENAESAEIAMMLCEAILEDPLAATAGGTVEMTAAESFSLVLNLYNLLSANYLSTEISAILIEIQAVKLTEPLTDEEAAMVVDIVAQLNVLIVNIEVAVQVITVELVGVLSAESEAKIEILMANEASAQTLLMLCEAIAVDAISATASGFVVMSPMELFGLVTQVYDFLSLDLLYVGQIQSLMMEIQSAQLDVALSEEELAMVNMIVADFSVLIITIQSSITIIKAPLAEEVKVDILEENKESTNTTLGFMVQVLADPVEATTSGTVEMTWMQLSMLVMNLHTAISSNYLIMGDQCPPPPPPHMMGYGSNSSTSSLTSTGSTSSLGSTGSTTGSTAMDTTTVTVSSTESTTGHSFPPHEMCMSSCMMGPTPLPTTAESSGTGTSASMMSTTMTSITSTESGSTTGSTGTTGSSAASSASSTGATGSSMASSSSSISSMTSSPTTRTSGATTA